MAAAKPSEQKRDRDWLQDEQWADDLRRDEAGQIFAAEIEPGADDDFEASGFRQAHHCELAARGEDWPGHQIGTSSTINRVANPPRKRDR